MFNVEMNVVFLFHHILDSMENWVALISTMYAEMIAMRCLRKKEKLCNSILPLITHFMAKGNKTITYTIYHFCYRQSFIN